MPTLSKIYETVKELRKSQTKAEKLLWNELKSSRLKGYKFRRQHPVIYFNVGYDYDFFVADFYCASAKLIIEVDGEVHNEREVAERDEGRQAILEEKGYKVIRFKNNRVFDDMMGVIDEIENSLVLNR